MSINNHSYIEEGMRIYRSKCINPVVSVCVITYNKEKFIKDALDSVLMQIMDYEYEIVVGDNASTDSTPNILLDYYNRNSNKMTIILNNKNIELTGNLYNTMLNCRGKYIIILYGDDYFISDRKLDIQTRFLEENDDYIGVTSVVESRYDGEFDSIHTYPELKFRNSSMDLQQFLKGHNFPMLGLMFRNYIKTDEGKKYYGRMLDISRYIDDLSFCTLLLNKGKIFIIDELMSVYRLFKPKSGINNFNTVNSSFQNFEKHIYLINKLDEYFGTEMNFKNRYVDHISSGLLTALKTFKFARFLKVYRSIPKRYRKVRENVLVYTIIQKLRKKIKRKVRKNR